MTASEIERDSAPNDEHSNDETLSDNGHVARDRPLSGATVVINSPEDLIASVPSLLGFVPRSPSLVAVCGECENGNPGPVMRLDAHGLVQPHRDGDHEDVVVDSGPAQQLADLCERQGIAQVHLVLVHPGCAGDTASKRRARDAVDVTQFWLDLVGTTVAGALGVGTIGHGESWVDLWSGHTGVQTDPRCTELAARAAVDGRVCSSRREDIDELYRTRDHDACGHDDASQCGSLLAPRQTGITHSQRESVVAHHDEVAQRMGAGQRVSDEDLATVGRYLSEIPIRDAVLARLARTGFTDGQGWRELWWAIARRRPNPERSVALTLLGAAHYFSGSGVHAWSALTEAVTANPRNGLAPLMLQALELGMPPERIRDVAFIAE